MWTGGVLCHWVTLTHRGLALISAGIMLGHRRTRCASIMPALGQRLLLADVFCVIRSRSHTGF